MTIIASWMAIQATFKLPLHWRIRRKPHSHGHLAPMLIGACLLVFVMRQPHFKGVCLVFSMTWQRECWKFSWMI